MDRIYLAVGTAGFLAAMVDGSLGMGFGPTSTTVLLAAGVPPSATSAAVNIAKVAGGLAAGISHWRFGNVDWKLVRVLGGAGAVGAVTGAIAVSRVDAAAIRPLMSAVLLVIGLRMLIRFSGWRQKPTTQKEAPIAGRIDVGAGFLGGVTNAMVGAWGPVVTPWTLNRGFSPRTAVGSVNTAEVIVAAISTGSLFALLSSGSLDVGIVVSMLVGGVLGAPLAAWAARILAPRLMGVGAGTLLMATNVTALRSSLGRTMVGIVVVCIAFTAALARLRRRTSANVAVSRVGEFPAGEVSGDSCDRWFGDVA